MKQFTINKHHPDFDGIRWASKAILKDGFRGSLEKIYINSGEVVGCDGHRLHVYQLTETIKQGLYTVIKNNAQAVTLELSETPLGDYIDFEIVWPDFKNIKYQGDFRGTYNRSFSTNYTMLIRNMNDHYTFDIDFIKDITTTKNRDKFTYILSRNESKYPAYFTNNKNKWAAVMPIRL